MTFSYIFCSTKTSMEAVGKPVGMDIKPENLAHPSRQDQGWIIIFPTATLSSINLLMAGSKWKITMANIGITRQLGLVPT